MIQCQSSSGRKYQNLRKKIHKAGKKVSRSNGKDREEMERLNRIRAQLIETQRQSERYVRIALQDIPQGAHIRPIHRLPGQIIEVTPEEYDGLLRELQGIKTEPERRDAD